MCEMQCIYNNIFVFLNNSNISALYPFRSPRKHVVDTDIHFYHVPSHADASKKRITQDTEDWRPRTGTTQSRSFKILAQITGTENGMLVTKCIIASAIVQWSNG